MSERDNSPADTPAARAARAARAREDRLASALRANLRRRKQATRAAPAPEPAGEAGDEES